MKGPRKYESYETLEDLRVAPLLGFAFCLLLLIVITVPLAGRWDAPPSDLGGTAGENKVHVLRMDGEHVMMWDGVPIERLALEEKLTELGGFPTPPGVVLEVDQALPSGESADLLFLITQKGIQQAAMTTFPSPVKTKGPVPAPEAPDESGELTEATEGGEPADNGNVTEDGKTAEDDDGKASEVGKTTGDAKASEARKAAETEAEEEDPVKKEKQIKRAKPVELVPLESEAASSSGDEDEPIEALEP